MDLPKTVVIGAGAVGLCTALALQRAGVPTLLLDPGDATPPASWGNAGHIATEQVAPLASLAALASAPRRLTLFGGPLAFPLSGLGAWLPFGVRMALAARPARFAAGKAALSGLMAGALAGWREVLGDIGRPELLIESGHLIVWNDPAAARRGKAAWLTADLGPARCREARPEELAPLAALVHRTPAGGVVFENTAQVRDPGLVLEALGQAFLAAGGERRRTRVRRIIPAPGALETENGRIAADRIVVTAGVKSGALLRPLGLKVPIIAERGYHIQTADHDWPEGTPPVVFEERATIVTRFASGLRAASFVELTQADAPPDERCWQRLEKIVAGLGLPMRGPFSRWHGSRPTLPDYLPAIGQAPGAGNLFYAFGHQHLGLTLAAITARHVATMLATGAPPPALADFSLARF